MLFQYFCLLSLSLAAFVAPSFEGSPPFWCTFWQSYFRSRSQGLEDRQTLHGSVELGSKQKTQPSFLLVDQEPGEFTCSSAVCETSWGMWKSSKALCWSIPCCPLWHFMYAFISDYSLPHESVYLYCMFFRRCLEHMTLAVFMPYSGLQALQNQLSCPGMCTTYLPVCMCECTSGKEGQVLHSSCCQGRQT